MVRIVCGVKYWVKCFYAFSALRVAFGRCTDATRYRFGPVAILVTYIHAIISNHVRLWVHMGMLVCISVATKHDKSVSPVWKDYRHK